VIKVKKISKCGEKSAKGKCEGHVVEGIHLRTFPVLSEMSLNLAVSGVSARQHEAS
jgi:hypothetical protein